MVSDASSAESSAWVSTLDRDQLATQFRAQAGAFRELLARKAFVRRDPPVKVGEPQRWSAVEHGCSVRDALEVLDDRLGRMVKTGLFGRRSKAPTFTAWDRERAAAEGDYRQADVDKLTYNLAATAGKVADQLDRVRGEEWEREASGADGTAVTVESLARQFLADMHHQRRQVEAGYAAIAEHDKEKAKARRAAQLAAEPESEPGSEGN